VVTSQFAVGWFFFPWSNGPTKLSYVDQLGYRHSIWVVVWKDLWGFIGNIVDNTAWVLYKNSLYKNLRGSIPRRATYFQLHQTHSTLRIWGTLEYDCQILKLLLIREVWNSPFCVYLFWREPLYWRPKRSFLRTNRTKLRQAWLSKKKLFFLQDLQNHIFACLLSNLLGKRIARIPRTSIPPYLI